MNPKLQVSTSAYFRTLSMLHLALTAGQAMFVLIALLLKALGSIAVVAFPPEVDQLLPYLAPVLAAGGIAIGWMFFKQKIMRLKMLPASAEKYTGYRSASILRYAIMEGPSLIAIVLFILSGAYYYLAVAGVVIAAFFTIRPTPAALIKHLQPSFEEQGLLEDPDAVLYEDGTASID